MPCISKSIAFSLLHMRINFCAYSPKFNYCSIAILATPIGVYLQLVIFTMSPNGKYDVR